MSSDLARQLPDPCTTLVTAADQTLSAASLHSLQLLNHIVELLEVARCSLGELAICAGYARRGTDAAAALGAVARVRRAAPRAGGRRRGRHVGVAAGRQCRPVAHARV